MRISSGASKELYKRVYFRGKLWSEVAVVQQWNLANPVLRRALTRSRGTWRATSEIDVSGLAGFWCMTLARTVTMFLVSKWFLRIATDDASLVTMLFFIYISSRCDGAFASWSHPTLCRSVEDLLCNVFPSGPILLASRNKLNVMLKNFGELDWTLNTQTSSFMD